MTRPRAAARAGTLALALLEVTAVTGLVTMLTAGLPVEQADGVASMSSVSPSVSSSSSPSVSPSSRRLDAPLVLGATESALLSVSPSPTAAASSRPSPIGLTAAAPVADVPDPVGLTIAAIGLDAPLTDIGRDASGVLVPPANLVEAGWYAESSRPGALGPAVIAGHVDDTRSAGVFARLRELVPGDEIEVRRADGSVVTYAVTQLLDVSKSAFPTDAVYGATPDAQLRLITCNTPYDFEAHHYAHNLVVFASLVS